jgi:ferredoxin
MTHIVADTSRCVGAGQCVLTDADTFDQSDEDGTVIVLRPDPTDEETLQKVKQAVHICPSQALSLQDS